MYVFPYITSVKKHLHYDDTYDTMYVCQYFVDNMNYMKVKQHGSQTLERGVSLCRAPIKGT